MSARPVLWLRLVPLPSGVWSVTSRTSVEMAVTDGSMPATWEALPAAGDFKPTNAFVNTLHDVRVGGLTVPEWCQFDGVSLWQFLPSFVTPTFFRSIEMLSVVLPAATRHAPRVIRAFAGNDDRRAEWQGVVTAAAAHANAVLEWTGVQSVPSPRTVARRLHVGRLAAQTMARTTYTVMDLIAGRRGSVVESAGRCILGVTRPRDWVRDPAHPGRFHDEQFYPLLPALRERGWTTFVGVESLYTPYGAAIRALRSRIRQADPGVAWLAAPFDRGTRRLAARHFARVWREMTGSPDWRRSITKEGVALVGALERDLHWAFTRTLPDCAALVAGADRCLAQVRPAGVLATYENGPFARAFIIAARRHGIPSLGLQHGTIFPDHYDYMHTRISPGAADPLGIAVPDVTCVWGPVWKESLTHAGHYPASAVAVTGHWRYDDIASADAAGARTRIRDQLALPQGERLVAILSSAQATPRFLRASIAALPDRSYGAIRLHPFDDEAAGQAAIAAVPPRAEFCRSTLAELLQAADVVVAQWSTVVAEAVVFGKPVVLVNLERLPGPEQYAGEGICVYVEEEAAIGPAIAACLDDNATRSRLEEARGRFIERYFHRLDGQSAARVAAVLDSVRPVAHRPAVTSNG